MQKKKNISNNEKILLLLEGDKRFRAFIVSARKKLGIPEKGFLNEEMVKKWYEIEPINDESYLDSVAYKKHEVNLFNKVKTGESTYDMVNKTIGALLDERTKINQLSTLCDYLVRSFGLPFHMNRSILTYIFYNRFTSIPVSNYDIVYNKKNQFVSVKIYADLTRREVNEMVKFLRIFTKNLPKLRMISDKTIKNLSFENWRKDNEKQDVEDRITAKDIAEEYLGSSKSIQKVYDSKRVIKRNRKKRFG